MNTRHYARLATFKEQGRQGFGEGYTQKMPKRPNTSCNDLESRYTSQTPFLVPEAPIPTTFLTNLTNLISLV
jgi:hypothetical protein